MDVWLEEAELEQIRLPRGSILNEAHQLVHGERGAHYGPPHEDFGRTAVMVSALLERKLKEPLDARDVALFMICIKLSRESYYPKRDNRVDIAGYAETLNMVEAACAAPTAGSEK